MVMIRTVALAAAALALCQAATARAQDALPAATEQAAPAPQPVRKDCADGVCRVQLTPDQLLAAAEKLVRMGRFAEARPLVEALRKAPGYGLQTRFLTGYMAAEEGRHAEAADQYKAILADDPGQTRVRLELAKAMLALGDKAGADRQFRLAAQDRDLPPEIARTIRLVRNVIRADRAWRLDLNFGLAPDTNINNATSASTVTVQLGDLALPLTLDSRAKAKSGTGITGNVSGGLRLPVARKLSALIDVDAVGTNYAGADYDDYQVQLAAGPELRLSERASIYAEGVIAQRWYGGRTVTRQAGVRFGGQATIGNLDRVGMIVDLRNTDAQFDDGYSGWQGSIFANWEHAVSRTLVVSTGAVARRDWLNEKAYSSNELGANAGIGGELPMGINFALSAGISRARFDAPLAIFSVAPRHDTRATARATLGNRKIRVFGFSPEIAVSYLRNKSSYTLYDTSRTRVQFNVARYF